MFIRFLCALCAMTLCFLGPAVGEERLQSAVDAGELVRLHVVADSDDEDAQALKMEVRDSVLLAARLILRDCTDAQTAYARLTAHLSKLEAVAQARAEAEGFEGNVTARTGMFDFPDKTYGDTLVPAGRYRALRVTIGSGEGRNWWCVVYPSLCFQNGGEYRWALIDWIEELLGGNEE